MRVLILICLAVFLGCDSGEDDQQESVSSESNVDIVDCSGAVFDGLDAEEVAELVEAADEEAEIVIEESGVFDQQTRTFKLTIIQGCGNGVVNEDNDTVSDDDFDGSVDFGSSEEADA